jgi:tight adherence protein C
MNPTTLLIFAAVAAFTVGLGGILSRRAAARKRLSRLADGGVVNLDLPEDESTLGTGKLSFFERALNPLADQFGKLGGGAFGPVRERLVMAGYRRDSAISTYTGARVACAIGFPTAFLLGAPVFQMPEERVVGAALLLAGLGLVLPSFWLDQQVKRRQRFITNGLPDALDLMVVCVEAGLGITACLARVAREFAMSNPVLSAEFNLVTLEIRHGKSNTEALRSLAVRTGVGEISSLVAMLVQTERFGTSLADTLRVHSDEMRVKRILRAEEAAGKLPIKMLFPTVLIFIASLIVSIGPGMMQLMDFFE